MYRYRGPWLIAASAFGNTKARRPLSNDEDANIRAFVAAIALFLAAGVTAPSDVYAFELPTVKATHHRAEKLVDCTPKGSIGSLVGAYEYQYVRRAAGIRMWRKDGFNGPSITYCFDVNNGYDSSTVYVDPGGNGTFRLPKWMRWTVESVRLVTNQTCTLSVSGFAARKRWIWAESVTGNLPTPPKRRWRSAELPERLDNRVVSLAWHVSC